MGEPGRTEKWGVGKVVQGIGILSLLTSWAYDNPKSPAKQITMMGFSFIVGEMIDTFGGRRGRNVIFIQIAIKCKLIG